MTITRTSGASLPLDGANLPSRGSSDPGRKWRVLLINPPFQRLKGVNNLYFPLGLGYLAGSLKQAGFDCGIYNAENAQEDEVVPHNHLSLLDQHWMFIEALKIDDHLVWREVRDTVQRFAPDILGISVMTPVYGSAAKINKIVRGLFPHIPIIWGGSHPTVQAGEVLADEREVTAVVMGEGEITMTDLCKRMREGQTDFSGVAGVACRVSNTVFVNPSREHVQDLDGLAWPDRSASLNIDAYFRDPERASLGNIFGSRGCPFKCAYCSSHTIWARKVRYRTPESIVAEMKTLQSDFGVERFSFLDDTFTMNRKWATAICENIKRARLRGRWGCYTRLDVLTEPLLKTMQSAGLAEMDVGIETGSQRIADFLEKDINLDRVRQMAGVLNRRRVNWNAFIMIGLPDETLQDIQATVDFIHEVKPVRCILSVFTPYPGDRLYEFCKSRGLIGDKPDWSRYSHHSPENNFVKGMAKQEMERLVKHVFVLVDQYNNGWQANYRIFRANSRLYIRQPVRFMQKAVAAAGRMLRSRARTTTASTDLARVSGRGAGV